ncbi:MAG: hypothetical protein IPL32_01880 [Chloracidobacterium sp.]|nr:hypothetical protein [Chloracidobacterium sp.]
MLYISVLQELIEMPMNYVAIATVLAIVIYFLFFRGSKPQEVSESEQNDAKRFARLLVAQIKLTETFKLERGIKQKDIYESLKIEIDEARKTFRLRIATREYEQYFDDQLIELLAEGDRGLMGTAYLLKAPY